MTIDAGMSSCVLHRRQTRKDSGVPYVSHLLLHSSSRRAAPSGSTQLATIETG